MSLSLPTVSAASSSLPSNDADQVMVDSTMVESKSSSDDELPDEDDDASMDGNAPWSWYDSDDGSDASSIDQLIEDTESYSPWQADEIVHGGDEEEEEDAEEDDEDENTEIDNDWIDACEKVLTEFHIPEDQSGLIRDILDSIKQELLFTRSQVGVWSHSDPPFTSHQFRTLLDGTATPELKQLWTTMVEKELTQRSTQDLAPEDRETTLGENEQQEEEHDELVNALRWTLETLHTRNALCGSNAKGGETLIWTHIIDEIRSLNRNASDLDVGTQIISLLMSQEVKPTDSVEEYISKLLHQHVAADDEGNKGCDDSERSRFLSLTTKLARLLHDISDDHLTALERQQDLLDANLLQMKEFLDALVSMQPEEGEKGGWILPFDTNAQASAFPPSSSNSGVTEEQRSSDIDASMNDTTTRSSSARYDLSDPARHLSPNEIRACELSRVARDIRIAHSYAPFFHEMKQTVRAFLEQCAREDQSDGGIEFVSAYSEIDEMELLQGHQPQQQQELTDQGAAASSVMSDALQNPFAATSSTIFNPFTSPGGSFSTSLTSPAPGPAASPSSAFSSAIASFALSASSIAASRLDLCDGRVARTAKAYRLPKRRAFLLAVHKEMTNFLTTIPSKHSHLCDAWEDHLRVISIRIEQSSTQPILPLQAFRGVIEEIGQNFQNDLIWTREAIEALREAAEAYQISLFRDCADTIVSTGVNERSVAKQSSDRIDPSSLPRRQLLQPKDIQLSRRIRQERY